MNMHDYPMSSSNSNNRIEAHLGFQSPTNSYSSHASPMPTFSQQAMPMQQSTMPMLMQPDLSIDQVQKFMHQLQASPSDDQIQTFRQRAWSSEEFQIALHERVGEMCTWDLINEEQEKTLYHLIHQRDHAIIERIIKIGNDYAETMTEKMVSKEELNELKEKLKKNLNEETKWAANVKLEPFLSARLPFKRTSRKRGAHILQVPCNNQKYIFNVPLVRYFVENVWKLERPDVIISVTGGASLNFDLHPDKNDMLMRGMMEGTRKLKPWFITGGTNAGIMKGMGEARAKYSPSAPLIGVTSLPGIAGGLQLRRMNTVTENKDVDQDVAAEEQLQHTAWLQSQLKARHQEKLDQRVDPADLERFPTLKEIQERCDSLQEDMSYTQFALQVCCCFRHTTRGSNGHPAVHELRLPTYVHNDPRSTSGERSGATQPPEARPPRKFQQDLSGAWIECSTKKEKDLRGNTKPGEGSEMSYDDLVQVDEKGKDKPHLDPNHSHFILLDAESDEKKPKPADNEGFGPDRVFRAAFESYVAKGDEKWKGIKETLSKKLHGMDVRGGRGNASHNIADHDAPNVLKWKEVGSDQPSTGTEIKNERLAARLEKVSEKTIEFKQEEWDKFQIKDISSDSYIKAGCCYFKLITDEAPIPVVSVCVQGGAGTVDTVLQACKTDTPALLVRGSGKAADLLSDAVILQYAPSHRAHVSHFDNKQDAFWEFLKLCFQSHQYEEVKDNLYDWGKAIEYIQSHRADPCLLKNAVELVKTTYKLVAKSDHDCLKIIKDCLDVAQTQKCWVFDLQRTEPGSDDFNLALLKCLLNAIAPVGKEDAEQLWKKLELSMIWSCDYIIDYILERMPESIGEKQQIEILDKALLFSLKKHNVHAVSSLIHRGTGMQMLDVGNGFCYVKDFSNYCEDYSTSSPEREREREIEIERIKEHFVTFFNGEILFNGDAAKSSIDSKVSKFSSLHLKVWRDAMEMLQNLQLTRTFFNGDAAKSSIDSKVSKFSSLHLKVWRDADKSSDQDSRDYKDRYRYFGVASKWTDIIDEAKEGNSYFDVLWHKAEKRSHDHEHENVWEKNNMNTYGKYKEDCLQAAHPIPEDLRLVVYQYHCRQKSACQDILDILSILEGNETATNMMDLIKELEKRVTNMMNILLLEGLYVDLCGPAFRYRMGLLGDQWFDVFFWYVLQNEKDLAYGVWKHVKYPVRSAICAAYLLRQMAKNKNIDPIDRDKMLDNSMFFDKQAANVQRAAEDDDEHRELAAESLHCELLLWRGISLMDLAVQGECESFLKTESFKRSVHCQLYGDLSPSGNDEFLRQIKLICSTLTFGLPPTFFAGLLEWAPPPRSEVVRHSTQRRVMPKGYPDPSQNPTLKRELQRERERLKSKDGKKARCVRTCQTSRKQDVFARVKRLTGSLKMRDKQLERLWAPTFGMCERWGCFMSAPYVLFLFNCLVTFGVTLFFTVWFVWMRLQPSSFSNMHDNMTDHEIFLNVYFVGCAIREISQLSVSYLKCQGIYKGFSDYINDVWNVPEVLGLIFFFVGFWWRFACTKSGGCEPAFSAKDNSVWFSFSLKDSTIETYNLFYALSLFFNWIRVLRCLCLTSLGVTIGIFFRMLTDVFTWLLLYVILLVAISMLFVGTASVDTLVPGYETCSKGTDLSGDDPPENGYIACSLAYVFIRPMLQSFGEFSLAEMTNLYSFAFLLVTYFFLNLVLINLLIATMSSTYNNVSAKAEHWKLLYEYELVQEHARRSIAFPPPFNLVLLILDVILYFWYEKNVKKIYPDYTRGQRLERFLARNRSPGKDSRVRGATHSSQDHGSDQKIQREISVFDERAQRTVMNKHKGYSTGSLEDRLEGKLDSISKDTKSIQDMQQASARGTKKRDR